MPVSEQLFKRYVQHVLNWEGTTSHDPDDGAADCAPYPGAVHTVKGVTYCTFNEYAEDLGIYPASYQRFLQLSDEDIAKFVWLFMEKAQASPLADIIALSVTEAAWMSGPTRGVKHLQEALNALGANPALVVDGILGPKTMAAGINANRDRLFFEYWKKRQEYLEYLIRNGYAKYADGWRNRVNDFLDIFSPGNVVGPAGAGIAGGLLLLAVVLFITKPKVPKLQ